MYTAEKDFISIVDYPNTKLQYVLQQRANGNEVVFWLKIKQEALATWRKEKLSGNLPDDGFLFIDLVNMCIPGNTFRLNRESVRLEAQLSNSCIVADAKRRAINKKGSPRQRKEFLASYKKLAVLRNDIISVEDLTSDISSLQHEVNLAETEINVWKQKYTDLEKEKQDLLQEMLQEKELFNSCREEREQMRKYIRQLEKDQFTTVRGTAIPIKASNNTSPK